MPAKLSCYVLYALAAFIVTASANASPINGDFSNGLDDWTTLGSVTADDGGAKLSDDGPELSSALYQGEALTGNDFTLSFDFRTDLSPDPSTGPFSFVDTFFATLYLTDDLSGFDLSPGSYEEAMALFSEDHAGAFDVSGTISASTTRVGWSTFEIDFSTGYAYAIPTFELFEQNLVFGDSAVWVDNVQLNAVIPEPSIAALLGLGLVGVALSRRRA